MEKLAVVFWVLVAGIGVTFAGSIYSAVEIGQQKKAREAGPEALPAPAIAPTENGS